jgi:membrane-associated HD superfamily phosphohydrolase
MSLFLHPARAQVAARRRSGTRIGDSNILRQKKRLPATTGSLPKSQRLREGGAHDYIALLVVVVVVFVVVVAFMSAALPVAFMSVAPAFMSVVVVVEFMSVVVRFSSTFMVLLALSLLLQAATARAAPATRIRARIQDSLIIVI